MLNNVPPRLIATCALVFTGHLLASGAAGQDWATLGEVLDSVPKFLESAVGAGSKLDLGPTELNSVSSLTGNQGFQKRDTDQPSGRVYIEHNGELVSLKGWVQKSKSIPRPEHEKLKIERLLKTEAALLARVNQAYDISRDVNDESVQQRYSELKTHRNLRRQSYPNLNTAAELLSNIQSRKTWVPARVEEIGRHPFLNQEVDFREGDLTPLTSVSNRSSLPATADTPKSDTTVFEKNGQHYKRTPFLLPAPRDSNDLFILSIERTRSPRVDGEQELAIGNLESRMTPARELNTGVLGDAIGLDKVYTQFRATPSFGVAYDTRTTGKSFNIEKLPTERRDTDGQTTFSGGNFEEFELPTTLLVDTQAAHAGESGRENQVQVHLEATNHQEVDKFQVEHAYVRVWTNTTTTIGAGKTVSLFGSNGLAPASIQQSTALIGSGDLGQNNRTQLRFQRNYAAEQSNVSWGVGMESPFQDDFQVDDAVATKLQRWPTLTSNLTFRGANPGDILQLGSMIRNVGLQINATDEELFEACYGVSIFGSRVVRDSPTSISRLYGGFSGGKGVGQYIRGVSHSSVFHAGNIQILDSTGAYLGTQHRWINHRGWELSTNLVYGYAALETPGGGAVANETNNQLHHAWANLFVKTSDQLSYGVEWQYGRRETFADGNGENHRLFFGIQITSAPPSSPKTQKIFYGESSHSYQENALLTDTDLFNEREYRQSFAHRQGL